MDEATPQANPFLFGPVMVGRQQRVFVDLDGVVADFTKAVLALHGFDPNTFSENKGSYDIAQTLGLSATQFWKHLEQSQDFWANIPLTEEALPLMTHLESRVPKEQIFFLTSPSLHPSCHQGKAEWVKRHFGTYLPRLILTSHKYLLADQNHFLIDDSDRNIHLFKQFRGRGILFPRPWNSRFTISKDPLTYVFRELRL